MSEALAPMPPSGDDVAGEPAVDGDTASPGPRGPDQLIDLLHRLAAEGLGLEVIYEALDLVADRFALDDAVVAVEHDTTGVQAFRLHRRAIGAEELERIRGGETFLSAPGFVPPAAQRLVAGIAEVALAMQLARRHVVRDRATGLLSRGVFNEALRAAAAQSSRYGWVFTVMVLRVGDDDTGREQEIVRLGHAFGRALRSGDTGARLYGATFTALLPNATAESVHGLLRRFAEESGAGPEALHSGSASAPRDSVDPAELFRIATDRMHEG